MNTQNVILTNGVSMPILGFGTFKIPNGNVTVDSVRTALSLGYRHIDTAAIYGNEESVGEAIRQSGLNRNELFITTKLWNSDHGYDSTFRAFDKSLEKLGLDYIDLYLIHWPKPLNLLTWRAMENIYLEKRVRAIGVSNFHIPHLLDLLSSCRILPMVNQVEFHPHLIQPLLLKYCQYNEIQYEAWSPLMQGQAVSIPLLQKMAEKYGRTVAQIVLRWDIQMGVVTIPKSINPDRIRENFEIFDFEISEEDMKQISSLNNDERVGPDPDNFNF